MQEYFTINIGDKTEVNISKIKYILPPEMFDRISQSIKIKSIIKNSSGKIMSYVVIEEFGEFYALESKFSSNNLYNKIK